MDTKYSFPLVFSATRSQDVIFYSINNFTGVNFVSKPTVFTVVAQNATTNAFINSTVIPIYQPFPGASASNLIATVGEPNPGFFVYDGRTIFKYDLESTVHGLEIKPVTSEQLCTTNENLELTGTKHIQAPSHIIDANLTIDNIVSGVCNVDNVVWLWNGNTGSTMSTVAIHGNCQFLIDGFINLDLPANQHVTTLCATGQNILSQTGQQEYTVSQYTTNGPTILNGGHIVATNILNTTRFPPNTFSKVQNLDYTGFTFLDVGNFASAKPITMQDTCPAGDCPKVFNVWQNFESGSSSVFFKNGIVVNYDKALKGIRIYNTGNSTQLGSRTCGTDCFPVSISTVPWLSMTGENPNLVYEGTFNSITLWNTTAETSAYYSTPPTTNPPGNTPGNQCSNVPSYTYHLSFDSTLGSSVDGSSLGNNATAFDNYMAGQQILPSNSLVGKQIGKITYYVPLTITTSVPANSKVIFGAFSTTNATLIRGFATLDLSNSSQFSAGTNIFNITLPQNNPYTVTGNEILGYAAQFPRNTSAFSLSWQDVSPDLVSDSFLVFFQGNASPPPVWDYNSIPTSDYSLKVYTQTQNPCNSSPGNTTTPPTAFCQNPANANILQCRIAGNSTGMNVGPGIQNLIESTGIFNLCSGTFKTNGFGYLITLILVIIVVGLLYVAMHRRLRDMPTFLWIVVTIAIFGFSTAIGCIDPTILMITIIAVIALGVASTSEILQGSLSRIVSRGEG